MHFSSAAWGPLMTQKPYFHLIHKSQEGKMHKSPNLIQATKGKPKKTPKSLLFGTVHWEL